MLEDPRAVVQLVVEILATLSVLVGVYFIRKPERLGLKYMILACILWGTFAVMVSAWFLFVQNLILLVMNVDALRNWKNKGIL